MIAMLGTSLTGTSRREMRLGATPAYKALIRSKDDAPYFSHIFPPSHCHDQGTGKASTSGRPLVRRLGRESWSCTHSMVVSSCESFSFDFSSFSLAAYQVLLPLYLVIINPASIYKLQPQY
jgi:hypothetical protein